MNNLMSYLFETNAVKVCPKDKPFWYTSGKIGPYFINTHFIYGSEDDANELLDFINAEKDKKLELPMQLFEKVKKQYEENTIYKDVIDEMISYIKENINVDEIDYISGGERRDWFFSYMASYILGKEHITLFKDLDSVISNSDFTKTTASHTIADKKVLHIADLMNQGSSYIRAWIPAIQNLGGELVWSLVVVDRVQGGDERLQALGIKTLSMAKIDKTLFSTALEKGVITENQFEMICKYLDNPDGTMRDFLIAHPEFLENALKSDAKTATRAHLCIDSDLYNLK